MNSWSELITRALPGPVTGACAEPLTVRAGEILTRVGGQGHQVSVIRHVLSEQEWERICAALASQEVFRARVLAGELPPKTDRVFALLGLDLVPPGWGSLVSTCSCPEWRGRCLHVVSAVSRLAHEADRDPFVLVRWAGSERKAFIARVARHGTSASSGEEGTFGEKTTGAQPVDFSVGVSPDSAAAFWWAPPPPDPPTLPANLGESIRAAAPGALADELPEVNRFET